MGGLLAGVRRFRPGMWMLLANQVGAFTGLQVVLLVYNLYLVELGYREDFIGLHTAATAVAMGLGSLGAVPLARRIGSARCMGAGTFLLVGSLAGMGLVESPAPVLALGALNGVATGWMIVPTGPYLMEHTRREERHVAFSVVWASQSLSAAIGSAVAGVLPRAAAALLGLADARGLEALRWTILIGAALGATGLLPVAGLVRATPLGPEPAAAEGAAGGAPIPRRSDRRLIAVVATMIFLLSVAAGFVLPFANVYLADRLGASTADIGAIWAVMSAAMVAATLAGPALSRRLGVVVAVFLARAVTAPLLLALAFVSDLGVVAVILVARAAFMSLTWPLDAAFGLELVSTEARSRLTSARSISFNVGWALASAVAGQVIIGYGYTPAFVVAAALTAVAATLHYRAFRGDDPHRGADYVAASRRALASLRRAVGTR